MRQEALLDKTKAGQKKVWQYIFRETAPAGSRAVVSYRNYHECVVAQCNKFLTFDIAYIAMTVTVHAQCDKKCV